jgi:hypothetical protein
MTPIEFFIVALIVAVLINIGMAMDARENDNRHRKENKPYVR